MALAGLVFAPTNSFAKLRLELLIMGPGDSVFSRFGHTAFRVVDDYSWDCVYNFGMTDFNRLNFVYDFMTGRVMFWGKVRTFQETIIIMKTTDRSVWRLPLALTDNQVKKLVAQLEHDVLPEYREYRYDTFRNNCATRLRDYLDRLTGGAVRAQLEKENTGRSFHDDVRKAYANLFWPLLGLEIVPGVSMDVPRNSWEMMYHPLTLGKNLQRVMVSIDGRKKPLAGKPVLLYLRKGPDPLAGWPDIGRFVLLALAFCIIILSLLMGRIGNKGRFIALVLWIVPTALIGLVMVVVHFWTSWIDMTSNWLCLGMVALDLWMLWPAVVLLRGRRGPCRLFKIVQVYLQLRFFLFLIIVLLGLFVPFFIGNLAPRLLVLAGLFMCWRGFNIKSAWA